MSDTPLTDELRDADLNAGNETVHWEVFRNVLDSHEELEAKLAAAQKDAERYRWLKSQPYTIRYIILDKCNRRRGWTRRELLDAVIDEAMKYD